MLQTLRQLISTACWLLSRGMILCRSASHYIWTKQKNYRLNPLTSFFPPLMNTYCLMCFNETLRATFPFTYLHGRWLNVLPKEAFFISLVAAIRQKCNCLSCTVHRPRLTSPARRESAGKCFSSVSESQRRLNQILKRLNYSSHLFIQLWLLLSTQP